MELYQKDGKKLKVYQCEASEKALFHCRKEAIKSLSIMDLFYELETTDLSLVQSLLNGDDIDQDFMRLLQEEKEYYQFKKKQFPFVKDIIEEGKVLENYIKGNYDKKKVIRMYSPYIGQQDQYMIPIKDYQEYQDRTDKTKYYYFDSIIQIPESLIPLELFERGEYDRLEHAILWDKIPYECYGVTQVDEILLTDQTLQLECMKKVRETLPMTEKILKKIR